MKGKAIIELRDAKNGRIKHRKEEHNLVTNALSQLVDNPSLPFIWGGASTINNSVDALNNFLPLAGKYLGGLLLLNDNIPEDPDTTVYQMPNSLITGYSGFKSYSGSNPKKGSLNATESGTIPSESGGHNGGYRFVYDFSTSQANGLTKCVALTSPYFGNTPNGVYPSGWEALGNPYTLYLEDFCSAGFLPNRTTYADISTETVYNSVEYDASGLFTDGTAALLAYEVLPQDRFRIYAARYVTSGTPELQIVSILTPSLQNMFPIISNWSKPGLALESVIWSTTNITNIHAKMFYYDADLDAFRCVRCTDTADNTVKNFELKTVTKDGVETNETFQINKAGFNCFIGACPASTIAWGVISNSSISAQPQFQGGNKSGFILDGVLYLCSDLFPTITIAAFDINNDYSELWAKTFNKQTFNTANSVLRWWTYINWQTRQIFFPTFPQFQTGSTPLSSFYTYMWGILCSIEGASTTKIGIGRLENQSLSSSSIYPKFHNFYLPCVNGENTPIKHTARLNITTSNAITLNMNKCVNPAYLATINNLETPISKTSDDTLKIIYEIVKNIFQV